MIRRLGVNIDHIATVRQARRSVYPEPAHAALIAEQAGAQQITCHIRGDRRHIQERDLEVLRAVVTTQLNVECAATDEMMGLMERYLPHRVTLVPERVEEVTTEGGLDLLATGDEVRAAAERLRAKGVLVSLFIDPDPIQVSVAAQVPGVDQIELNTARYAENHPNELRRLSLACAQARGLKLVVAAGHGLTHLNLRELVLGAPDIEEYNIGHSIVSRALFVGFDRAVRDIMDLLR